MSSELRGPSFPARGRRASDDLAQWRRTPAFRVDKAASSVVMFGLDYGLLGLLLGAGLWLSNPWLKLLAGLLSALVIGQLFVIGHDACHGSLSKSRRLNRVIGTLAFLPTLTPFSTWALGHNQLHHAYTNLRSHDYVWAPFSKAEYDALPPWRRALERLYRTPAGHGPHYFIEIWSKHLFFPRPPHVERAAASYAWDSALVAAWACGVAAVMAAGAYATGQNAALVIFCSLVVPYAVWLAIIGFLIFQHHTSPTIRWYDDEAEWSSRQSQVDSVQHVIFPGLLNVLFQNIMEHHAHHLDPLISLHHLGPAQAALKASLGPRVQVMRWTPRTFAETTRVCKLYDYETHRWRGFDGTYTTEPI